MPPSDEVGGSVSPQHPAHVTIIAVPRPYERPLLSRLRPDSSRGPLGGGCPAPHVPYHLPGTQQPPRRASWAKDT